MQAALKGKNCMKKFIAACIISSSLFFSSCDPAATFDKPQPEDKKSLGSFPDNLQGNYLATDQSSIVTVTGQLVTRHYDVDYKAHKDSIGSSYKIVADTLINLTDGSREKILLKGDTVIQHADWTDTIFNIPAGNVLKKFKGYYFLNCHYGDSSWEVKKLSLKKDVLTIAGISAPEDIYKLKEITETTADTVSTRFTLTRKQFKGFVKQGGFAEQETFIRMQKSEQ